MRRSAMIVLIACSVAARAAADDATSTGSGASRTGTAGTTNRGTATGSADDVTAICAEAPDPTACLVKNGNALPDFDKLRTPDSPAFTLLGSSPIRIDRPTTPKQLTAALGGFLADGGSVIPRSLAIELWPYWLVPHDAVSAVDYQNRGRGTQIWQNVTLSLGTSSLSNDAMTVPSATAMTDDTWLAAGARTLVDITAHPIVDCRRAADFEQLALQTSATIDPEGKRLASVLLAKASASEAARQQRERAEDQLARSTARVAQDQAAASAGHPASEGVVAGDISQVLSDRLAYDAALDRERTTTAELKAATQQLKDHQAARVAQSRQAFAELCKNGSQEAKQGLVAELAVAASERFVNGKTADHHFADAAVWAELAYESPGWSGVAVARGLMTRPPGGEGSRFFETGLRVIRSKDAYAFSLETGLRVPNATYRVAAAVDYHLQNNTWLTFSFGRDFTSGGAGSFFSLANVKFGIGDPNVFLPGSK